MSGLGELVDLGHGVVATHATVDHMHGLNPRKARAAIAANWPGSGLARKSPREVREAVEAAHRKVCVFHSTGGECAHTMFEPRVEPFAEAPRRPAAGLRRRRAAPRRRLLGLPWLQAAGILSGMAASAAVVARALAEIFR